MSQPTSAARTLPERPARVTRTVNRLLLAFIAGFIAVLAFHQSLLAVFVTVGVVSATPYSFAPAALTRLPQVLSRAVVGGVWGIVLVVLIESRLPRRPAYPFWIAMLAFGALLPSLGAWFIVGPIKGLPLAEGGDPVLLGVTLVINGAWGIGTAAVYRFLRGGWSR